MGYECNILTGLEGVTNYNKKKFSTLYVIHIGVHLNVTQGDRYSKVLIIFLNETK